MLECLRATPNLLTIRPADGNETVGAYICAIENMHSPSVISLSRQATPNLAGSSADKVALGAYILEDFVAGGKPLALIIVSTGTEVALSLAVAKKLLEEDGISVRIVSMPCWELFDQQSHAYQLSVFPDNCPVLSVEMSGSHGWRKYSHVSFGMESFGLSAPGNDLLVHFGFTAGNLADRAREVVQFYADKAVYSPITFPRFPKIESIHG